MSVDQIYEWLDEVKDPEIPTVSLVDLGVIRNVSLEQDIVRIELTPTFVGCPALAMMQQEITSLLGTKGVKSVHIEVSYREPWTTDRISEKGRLALKQFGIAPPPDILLQDIPILDEAVCPRCNGTDTELRSVFGATQCRSIHYCHVCRESFEQFKPL